MRVRARPPLGTTGPLLATAAALVALATAYAAPLADIDLWWHLATGRHLVQTGAFLSADPFGLAGAEITPGRELVLNRYWLSQVLLHGIHQLLGLGGIVALRVALLLTPPLAALVYCWRRIGLSSPVLLLVLLCAWAMVDVAGIRPNHLTVAFVPLLFILLAELGYAAELKEGVAHDLRKAWLVPVLMLVWANLHGGVLLGVAVTALYAASETVTLRWLGRPPAAAARLWGVVAAGALASAITPAGPLVYLQYLGSHGGTMHQRTSEYLSPVALARTGILVYWPYFIVLLLGLSWMTLRRFRVTATRLSLLLGLAALSLTAFRYAPLFVGAASILLAPDLHRWYGKTRQRHLLFDTAAVVLSGGLVLAAVSWYPVKAGALAKGTVDATRLPVGAADFLERRGLSGVVFNHFNWGAYLAWRQPGRLTTFVDGRNLNLPLFHAYTRVLWLPDEATAILDRRGVELIVVPRLNPFTGELYPLTDVLWRDGGWDLVYRDGTGMVFVRQGRFRNVERLSKRVIYQDVLQDLESIGPSRMGSRRFEEISAFARVRLEAGWPDAR